MRAEGLCSDASQSDGWGRGAGVPAGRQLSSRARETRAPPARLEGESVLWGLDFSAGSLKGTQPTPQLTQTSPASSGSSPCKQARCAKGCPGSKCHTSAEQPFTHLWDPVCLFTGHQLIFLHSGAAFIGAQ